MTKRLLTHSVGILHVHSGYSHDGRDSLAGLWAFAVAKGIAFVGLTDHAEDLDAAAFERLRSGCAEQSDASARLIPGLEFRFGGFDGLHLLALGLTEWIEPRTPEEFIRLARGRADLTVVAHPRLFRYRLPAPIAEGIDAIEVWNAAHNTRYLPDPGAIVLLNEVRRRRPEVVGTVGLDQHDSRNDREVRILLHRASSTPLTEIRAGRFTNKGRTMRFPAAVGWGRMRLGLLRGIRTIYDQVERIQDRTARALRSRRVRA